MVALLAQKKRIRSPVGAGMYYPEYKKEMLDFLRVFDLEPGNGGCAQAIIAPHGSWGLSGELVANAFSAAMGRSGDIKRVVILGPIHDKREKGVFLSNSHSFHTPLGNIPVDKEITEEMEFAGEYLEINDIPHLGEHSIEILLPFVKYCFPNASIVPILMGQPEHKYIKDLSAALKDVITPIIDETLLVVSCNLSCDNDKTTARFHAQECLHLFAEKDAASLTSAILDGSLSPCGGALVASLLDSGLLNKKTCYAGDMLSAAGLENNTVFYSAVSFE
ncbi:MAG: AmmeMemoRadiSam system protein B [Treponema sp.]|jgi:AmmeMemoRadiSam system protein B|nr:AmmeMemoRadiSam system protein B [Treponema sp.]